MPGLIPQIPNFFILGARRSGTASLTHYLGQHPAISFIEPRDSTFFQKDYLYARGIDYYIRTFCHNVNHCEWLGEATSSYFAYPHIIGPRLRATYGDAPLKFIVLLREPVSRAWSHYLTRVNHGFETRDFATVVAQEECESPDSEAPYITEGCYKQHLRAWQSYFPADSFLFLLSEDLAANPLAQVRRVCMWLGVDTTMPISVNERLNTARYSCCPKMVELINHPPFWLKRITTKMWPDVWQRHRISCQLREKLQKPYSSQPSLDPQIASTLREYYRDDVLSLSKELGRYLSHWLADEVFTSVPTQIPVVDMRG